jgi:hypothetical protein
VLDCAEPFDDDTLVWPESLLSDDAVLELLVESSVVDAVLVLVLDVVVVAWVVSRAARLKPAVAAMAVTARPAVTPATRRLPCSRDVIGCSFAVMHRTSRASLGGRCEGG